MKYIESPENSLIKEIIKIKEKPTENIFIEGLNLLECALQSEFSSVEKVLTTKEFFEKEREIFKEVNERGISVIFISDKISKKIADTVTPQGIFAVVRYKVQSMNDISHIKPNLIVIADKVQDPGNLGTIIRVAEALGSNAVFVTKGTCNPFSQKTLRASAGSIFFIPVLKVETEEIKQFLNKHNLVLLISDPHAEKLSFEVDLKKPVAVVLGSEKHGVSIELRQLPHISCRIPHLGKTESLNVAISSSILLYEVLRQRMIK
ncbi:TrmH family RNA methyltransferase [Thermodesulfovibrio hydrogeniphilus]